MVFAANQIEKGQPYQFVEYEHKNEIQQITTALYRETIEVFAERERPQQKSKYRPIVFKFEVPVAAIIARMISEWAQQHGGVLITEITETTMREINETVSQALIEGLTERELANRIKTIAPTKSASRAQTIARTEVHRAGNATTLQSVKLSGFERKKIWAAGGQRVRDTHRDADTQYRDGIPLDEPFIVGGARLMYPSDPSGPARETINCRCVMLFETVD
jgi:hypothetical protein